MTNRANMVGDGMAADEVAATRAYIEATYGGTSPMSRHSVWRHAQRDRDDANRDSKARQTLAHGRRQAGDESGARFQERAAREAAQRAVDAQRRMDAAEDRNR